MSDTKMTEVEVVKLGKRLLEIRKALPYLQKTADGYNYKYVPGSAVLAVVVSKMNELGVFLTPSFVPGTSHVEQTKDNKGKVVYLVHAEMVMEFWCVDDEKQRLAVPWLHMGLQDDPSRSFGSGLTYAERYFLLKFFNVPTDKDDPDRFIAEKGTLEMRAQREDSKGKTDAQIAITMTTAIADCMDLPTLLSWWQNNMKAIRNLMPKFHKQIEEVKDARKKELSESPPK